MGHYMGVCGTVECWHTLQFALAGESTIFTFSQLAFEVYPVVNGAGIVQFAWQKSAGNFLAITGYVHVFI